MRSVTCLRSTLFNLMNALTTPSDSSVRGPSEVSPMPNNSELEAITERLEDALNMAIRIPAPLLSELLRMAILEAFGLMAEPETPSPSIAAHSAE